MRDQLRGTLLKALEDKNKSKEMSTKEPWRSIGADNDWERRRQSVASDGDVARHERTPKKSRGK